MAIDVKYGKVTTEFGDIPDDEPVILFRAQDQNVLMLLSAYLFLCSENDSPRSHLTMILNARDVVLDWQMQNTRKIKVPDS